MTLENRKIITLKAVLVLTFKENNQNWLKFRCQTSRLRNHQWKEIIKS